MINLAISLGTAALVWILGTLVFDSFWAGLLPFVVIQIGLFFFLGKRTSKRLEAFVEDAQRHMVKVQKARSTKQRDVHIEAAINALKKGFVLRNHQFLVAAQLNAQIGQLYYLQQRFKDARPYLEKSFSRNWTSTAMLGCIHFKRKRYEEMTKAFEKAVKYNRKESMLWNLYAWCVWKKGDGEQAQKILIRALEVLKDNERLKSNLQNLRNKRKMKMRGWKEQWYQFHLEKAPSPKMRVDRRSVYRPR